MGAFNLDERQVVSASQIFYKGNRTGHFWDQCGHLQADGVPAPLE